MTGTGTLENPYVIMNVDDLYSMGETGGDDVYFSLGTDIDLSFTKYAEKFEPIPLNCLKFSGNGHMIRNVNCNIPESSVNMFSIMNETENSTVTIENLVLENIRLIGKSVFLFASEEGKKYKLSLEYCSFILNEIAYTSDARNTSSTKSCLIHDTNISMVADYCTFSLQIDFTRMNALFAGDKISHTQISAELSTIDFPATDDNYNALLTSVIIADSYLFASMKRRNATAMGNFNMSSSDSQFSRFYTVFEAIEGVAKIYWKGKILTPCFYNVEAVKKYLPDATMECGTSSSSNAKNIIALTTEQCKDVNYLRSINFDCLGAEEE